MKGTWGHFLQKNEILADYLNKISISEDEVREIRNKVCEFFKQISMMFPVLKHHAFGGSFDRYTQIRGISDIDVYLVVQNNHYRNLDGRKMLDDLYSMLGQFQDEDPPLPLRIKHGGPYKHAIPVQLGPLELDLLIAQELQNVQHEYHIPENPSVKITRPNVDSERVKELNVKSNGMGTNLIRLLKLWNYTQGRAFLSYQVEMLCWWIFRDKSLTLEALAKGIQDFLRESARILTTREVVFEEAVLAKLNYKKALEQIQAAREKIQREEWGTLFF